jgi:PAS domain S-box-containing protein
MYNVNNITKINQQLSLALEAAKIVIFDWDLLTNDVVWSSSEEELFGLASGKIPETYEAAVARIHPQDLEAVTVALNESRMKRQNYHQELRILGSDSKIHWIEAKGKFFYNDEGQAVRMLGTLLEISDRKAREEQLHLLESVILHTNEAVLITEAEPIDSPGPRIIYVNPAFTRITGYSLEEVLGKTPRILQGENTDRTTLDQIRTAMENWQSVQVEVINYTKEGEEFWVEMSIFPIKDQTGWYTHWVSVQRDITKRKQTEVALSQSQERFRQIAENIQDVFWISDPFKHRVLYVSPGYERIWGRKSKTPHHNWAEWVNSIHPDDYEKVQTTLREKELKGQPFEHEYRILQPDGTVRWIQDRGFPVTDESGQSQYVTGIAQDITERKQTELALKESEERFRQLAENIQDVFWICDIIHRRTLYISPAYEKIWGRTCESLYADWLGWMEAIHPDDQPKLQADFRRIVNHGQPFDHEYRILQPNGTVKWIRDRGFPVINESGQVQRVAGIAQDITERKHAEVALVQLNEKLEIRVKQRTVELENSQTSLQQQLRRERLMRRLTQQIRQSLNLTTVLNTVVTEVQQLLGADRVLVYQIQSNGIGITVAEAVVGEWTRIVDQIFPEETFPKQSRQKYLQGRIYSLSDRSTEEIVPCLADFLAELQVRAMLVVPIIQKDILWGLLIVHQCSEPRKWQNWEIKWLKQLTSHVAIAIQQSQLYQKLKEELGERKKTEVALRRSENLFRSLSEFAPVGIYLCDSQGRNIYTNPRCQAIYGCTFDESLGYGWLKLIHPEDLQIIPQLFTLLGGHQETQGELRFIHNDGNIRYCRMKSVPIFSELGEQITHVGITEDITDSLAIEKMKNEFISIVSHELRTPLAAIHGSLGLIASGVLQNQPETAQQMLRIASTDTERLVRLVNDILDLERLEAKKFNLAKRWCDAAELMVQSVTTLQPLAVQNNIKLLVLPSSVQMWADPDRIIQTLVNLVSNAIKFSPPKTTVTLSAQEQPDLVLFTVQDQGRGIPHDKLETIFARFQQVDASDSRDKGGTGLGLSICRSIIQQHGGKIWAESLLGKGSTFYFTLPQPLE